MGGATELGTGRIMAEAVEDGTDQVLRVGVVGVGVMGCNHARVLAELPAVQLVGVADPDQRDVPAAL